MTWPQAVKHALALVAVLLVPFRAVALQQPPPPIRISYINTDLGDVIRSLAAVLGVNVVLTGVPAVQITFQTAQPVPASEVGALLEAVLQSQGLVIVQTGPVAQVMPEAKKPATGPVRVGKEFPTPPPLGLVTQIVPLDYIRAEEAVTLLKQVAGTSARIEVVPRSNAVLITDRGSAITRYLELLRQLDVKTGGEIVAQTLEEVGRLARGLRPTLLDEIGLAAAATHQAEELVHQHGIVVDVQIADLDTETLPPLLQTTVYRVLQEALTNVARHAGARNVSVRLARHNGTVELRVQDDGRGFAPSNSGRLGLRGMRERATLLGGSITVESRPGTGTTITGHFPVRGT